MPPGARHELGGLIFATALRRAALPVVYLGADLPLDDWIAAVERTDARAVVIGAVMHADATAAMSVAEGLRVGRPEVLIAFGGPAAPDPDAATASAGTIRLPAELGEAVAALSASLPEDRASSPGARAAAGAPRVVDRHVNERRPCGLVMVHVDHWYKSFGAPACRNLYACVR